MRAILGLALLTVGLYLGGCAYRPYATDLEPYVEAEQAEGMTVADDGTVTFYQGRLEIGVRPMTDEELNRQFSSYSDKGVHSTNPYTYGNSEMYLTGETPRRFTVFRLSVKNYEFPKVQLMGDMTLTSDNGRKYFSLDIDQLEIYYRAYAIGYRGLDHFEYANRKDLLRRTLYPVTEPVFSGQEAEGYIMFRPLADDVSDVVLTLDDIVTRFDYRGAPVESIQAQYRFSRDIGRMYPDGRIELSTR